MNILYIHSHDTGRYIQPYGHAVPTPHLQRLAEEGMLFRQAFCASPTCSPSRVSLMTGQWAHCAGMFGLAHRGFRAADYSRFLPHTLKKAGYVTALAGIQHEAHLPTADPKLLGYDRIMNHNAEGGCFVERTVEVALDFLRDVKEPFFLSVGFAETHRHFPKPQDNPNYVLPPSRLPDMPETRGDMAGYIASARQLDENVGAILSALETRGLAGRTLVIYTTDHGIAFPGMKCTLSDHGLGVALIIRGPGGFDGGKVCDAMVTHLDLFPTLGELARLPAPSWLQGKSLLPLARGEAAQLRDAIFAEINYHCAYEPLRCVRTPRYKFVKRFDKRSAPVLVNCDNGPSRSVWLAAGWKQQVCAGEELYDLMFDPQEARNLAGEPGHEATTRKLREQLQNWMAKTDDPILRGPIPLPPGAIVDDPEALAPQ
ncbi:MAG TPA: sulfatase [Candidatus Limnocylindrales bacterium]|nr:sulfatase [Candidatus Limnocylindrales bacterium]